MIVFLPDDIAYISNHDFIYVGIYGTCIIDRNKLPII